MKKRLIFSVLIVALAFVGVSTSHFLNKKTDVANAQSAPNVHGWLWSDTTGWVALNCEDAPDTQDANGNTIGRCDSPYGVTENSDGTWTGYGWSPNAGWLQFNAGCPSGAEGVCGAKMEGTKLKGWARFVGATATINNGWDGWVSLSASNDHDFNTAGVQPSSFVSSSLGTYGFDSVSTTNTNPAYAWGSGVVGWILFYDVVSPPPASSEIYLKPALTSTTVTSANVESLADLLTLPVSTSNLKLYWYADNANTTYTSCEASSNGTSTWNSSYNPVTPGVLPSFSSTNTNSPSPITVTYNGGYTSQTYTITCNKQGGGTSEAIAVVDRVDDRVTTTLSGGREDYCPVGSDLYVQPVLSWNATSPSTSISNPITCSSSNNWAGSNSDRGSQAVNTAGSYSITCSNAYQSSTATATINYLDPTDQACDSGLNSLIRKFKFKEQ